MRVVLGNMGGDKLLNARNAERGCHVLIPAYQPGHNLGDIVRALTERSKILRSVVIVDDGSTLEESHVTFDELEHPPKVIVLHNDSNMGKGAALKVGMRRLLKDMRPGDVLVTADADGQHLPDDIVSVAEYAFKHQRSALGCRAFDGYIPLRSRIGNTLISLSLRLALGVRVRDTQTGLRALIYKDCKALLNLSGENYEYEFNCLIYLIKNTQGGPVQLPITTVYETDNPTSHFNPVLDSFRIYFTFLRYASAALLAALVDVFLFACLTLMHVKTLPALIIARVFSLPVYFLGMRNVVFKVRRFVMVPFLVTCGLVVLNILYLWQFIDFLSSTFHIYRWVAMIIGSSIFFVGNFLFQNYVLYRRKPVGRNTEQ